ncbi:MAG: WG repeat-containing protein [Bacteroidia bacterium]|nr:WG repeat-containing protein [Bacteroidia bacterium]NNL33964.1 WG repeat-containing protein [Flavobacteriaceae bacterium]
MRKKIIFTTVILLFSLLGFNQNVENIDFVAPFSDGLAAIEKDGQWGFINEEGDIVIKMRSDLVLIKNNGKDYPVFSSGRCLIFKMKEGIKYFGYIDQNGEQILPPQYLNATHFQHDMAIVHVLIKTNVGNSQMLKKPLVSYDYFEAIIDPDGEVIKYLLEDPIHVTLSKEFLRKPPVITSKFISNHLIAQWSKEKKWEIIAIE